MASESLFTNCHTCRRAVAKCADRCPDCGKRLRLWWRDPRLWAAIGLLIAAVAVDSNYPDIGAGAGKAGVKLALAESPPTEQSVKSVESLKPQDQQSFEALVGRYFSRYRAALNAVQGSALRDVRREALASAMSMRADGWIGHIAELDTTPDGDAVLSVRVGPGIEVTTWNNRFSDMLTGTLIGKGSGVYRALLSLRVGDEVMFDGHFFPSDQDFVIETSVTERGSMLTPEFLFSFESIQPINRGNWHGNSALP